MCPNIVKSALIFASVTFCLGASAAQAAAGVASAPIPRAAPAAHGSAGAVAAPKVPAAPVNPGIGPTANTISGVGVDGTYGPNTIVAPNTQTGSGSNDCNLPNPPPSCKQIQ